MKHNFYNFGYLYNKLCLYLCNFTNILKFDCNFGPNGAEVISIVFGIYHFVKYEKYRKSMIYSKAGGYNIFRLG